MRRVLPVLLVISIACGGCEATSNTAVTSESIVEVSVGTNLILDGRFDQPLPGPWQLVLPAGASERRESVTGQRALIIGGRAPGGEGPLVLEQSTDVLPDYRSGTNYSLRALVRTNGVSRPLEIELRLNYAGGGYEFFGTAASTPGRGASTDRPVPGTSKGWLTVDVHATARLPLTSIDAFAIDAPGPTPFTGTVWVRDVTLYAEGG